jgi:hypothetical protein
MKKLVLALLICFVAAAAISAQDTITFKGQVVCCAECWAEVIETRLNMEQQRTF